MSPVPTLGKSPAKIHCWVQPWPVSPRVAQIRLGPKGRKGGRGWDGAGKGMDAAGGAAACPRGAQLNGGDRGAARGCGGCPGVGLGWQHQPQLRDTLTRPKAGEAAGPPHRPTAHPGGGRPMGWGGQHPPCQALERGLGALCNPSEARCAARGCGGGGPRCGQSPSSRGGGRQGLQQHWGGGTGSATMASPHILKPHPTLCATGWHCWTPALGSLRHRNVYFSKFFVFVLFRFVFFFLQNLLPVPADGAWPPPELSTPSIPKAPCAVTRRAQWGTRPCGATPGPRGRTRLLG